MSYRIDKKCACLLRRHLLLDSPVQSTRSVSWACRGLESVCPTDQEHPRDDRSRSLGMAECLLACQSRRLATEGYHRCHANPGIEVIPFQSELVDSAVELYRTRPYKNWSLTDCLSFVVMENRRLTEALT